MSKPSRPDRGQLFSGKTTLSSRHSSKLPSSLSNSEADLDPPSLLRLTSSRKAKRKGQEQDELGESDYIVKRRLLKLPKLDLDKIPEEKEAQEIFTKRHLALQKAGLFDDDSKDLPPIHSEIQIPPVVPAIRGRNLFYKIGRKFHSLESSQQQQSDAESFLLSPSPADPTPKKEVLLSPDKKLTTAAAAERDVKSGSAQDEMLERQQIFYSAVRKFLDKDIIQELILAKAEQDYARERDDIKAQGLYRDSMPFVILCSQVGRSEVDKIEAMEKELRRADSADKKDVNFAVVMNTGAGRESLGYHWSTMLLDDRGHRQELLSSGNDDACGAYTILQIIFAYPALLELPGVKEVINSERPEFGLKQKEMGLFAAIKREFVALALHNLINARSFFPKEYVPSAQCDSLIRAIIFEVGSQLTAQGTTDMLDGLCELLSNPKKLEDRFIDMIFQEFLQFPQCCSLLQKVINEIPPETARAVAAQLYLYQPDPDDRIRGARYRDIIEPSFRLELEHISTILQSVGIVCFDRARLPNLEKSLESEKSKLETRIIKYIEHSAADVKAVVTDKPSVDEERWKRDPEIAILRQLYQDSLKNSQEKFDVIFSRLATGNVEYTKILFGKSAIMEAVPAYRLCFSNGADKDGLFRYKGLREVLDFSTKVETVPAVEGRKASSIFITSIKPNNNFSEKEFCEIMWKNKLLGEIEKLRQKYKKIIDTQLLSDDDFDEYNLDIPHFVNPQTDSVVFPDGDPVENLFSALDFVQKYSIHYQKIAQNFEEIAGIKVDDIGRDFPQQTPIKTGDQLAGKQPDYGQSQQEMDDDKAKLYDMIISIPIPPPPSLNFSQPVSQDDGFITPTHIRHDLEMGTMDDFYAGSHAKKPSDSVNPESAKSLQGAKKDRQNQGQL